METAPGPVPCTTPLLTVAGPLTTANVTDRPDEAVALSANGAEPLAWSPGGLNVIACAVLPVKIACALFARSRVIATGDEMPLASPLQPANRCVASGLAEIVTVVPTG